MPHAVVGLILVAHGLITTMIGFGSVTSPNTAALPVPSWINWWPGPFGRSWLLDAMNLGSGPAVVGGFIWLVAGLALMGGGLGWLGVSGLSDHWQALAFLGGALGLVALGLYFHPFYLVAVVIDVVVVVQVWSGLSAAG